MPARPPARAAPIHAPGLAAPHSPEFFAGPRGRAPGLRDGGAVAPRGGRVGLTGGPPRPPPPAPRAAISAVALGKYIKANFDGIPDTVKVPLGKALKKMVADKALTKVKSSFKLVKVEKPKPKKKKAPKKK